jgi:hypothetical protein
MRITYDNKTKMNSTRRIDEAKIALSHNTIQVELEISLHLFDLYE